MWPIAAASITRINQSVNDQCYCSILNTNQLQISKYNLMLWSKIFKYSLYCPLQSNGHQFSDRTILYTDRTCSFHNGGLSLSFAQTFERRVWPFFSRTRTSGRPCTTGRSCPGGSSTTTARRGTGRTAGSCRRRRGSSASLTRSAETGLDFSLQII